MGCGILTLANSAETSAVGLRLRPPGITSRAVTTMLFVSCSKQHPDCLTG